MEMETAEIIIYKEEINGADFQIEVRVKDDTIWLTQNQIVSLFTSSKANVSEHIKHIFLSKELEPNATVRKFRTVQIEGSRKVQRNIDHYNLDMIISIGYRVNSIRGTQFRIWANKVLKEYLLKGHAINHRLEKVENDVFYIKGKVNSIEFQINTNLPPNEGIFYNAQIFDAWQFASKLIKTAYESITLIDNYIDESVLMLLSKRNPGVKAIIYTGKITNQLETDLQKHNQQYPIIKLKQFSKSHDRFLIIDNKDIYHIGASLKDLGKKWFAFSKINLNANDMLLRLASGEQN
jgi:hypothetical protein